MFFLWSFNRVAEGPLPGVVVPEVWYHACHLFDQKGYTFYWQGKVRTSLSLPHSLTGVPPISSQSP